MDNPDYSFSKLKVQFIKSLIARKDKVNDFFLRTRSKSWTRGQLAHEIAKDSEEGLEQLIMMMNLAAHMISTDVSLNEDAVPDSPPTATASVLDQGGDTGAGATGAGDGEAGAANRRPFWPTKL